MKKLTLDLYIISRCTHNYYARELKKINLTMGQFPFIVGISEHDGISQEKLSAGMRISKSTTAAVVRQLLSAGLITREVDEADRRNFHLHLTPAAHPLLPKIAAIIANCHRVITQDLPPEERKSFVESTRLVRTRAEHSLSPVREESGKAPSGSGNSSVKKKTAVK